MTVVIWHSGYEGKKISLTFASSDAGIEPRTSAHCIIGQGELVLHDIRCILPTYIPPLEPVDECELIRSCTLSFDLQSPSKVLTRRHPERCLRNIYVHHRHGPQGVVMIQWGDSSAQ
jgi:hypothetical protein